MFSPPTVRLTEFCRSALDGVRGFGGGGGGGGFSPLDNSTLQEKMGQKC